MRSRVAICLSILMMSISGLSATPTANLLKNGTFSEGGGNYTPGWTFSFWMLKKGSPIKAAAKKGIVADKDNSKNKCLYLGTSKVVKNSAIWFQQEVACDPGQTYKLSLKVKGSIAQKKWGHITCLLYIMSADNKWLTHQAIKNVKFTEKWTDYSLTLTLPDNAEKIGVKLGIAGEGIFNVYFDDVKLIDTANEVEPQASKTKTETVVAHKKIDSTLPQADSSQFGSKISRTMTALATSTPEKRKKVRLLFYGQSIIRLPWTYALARRLQAKYPHADFTYKNLSIGGFEANRLVRTANSDLYPYYPDFVIFHDYGGNKGEFEAMIANLRKKTTAEILLTTHHISHQGNAWIQKEYDKQSQMIRDIAKKYDCELVDVRKEWKQYLKDNNLKPNDLLKDIVHLNKKGCALMEKLVWRHLRYNQKFKNPHAKWIKRIPVTPAKNGSVKLKFNGNRIDLVAGIPVAKMGTAKILIDNKPPSANPKAYTVTRTSKAPGAWWPAIYTISSKVAMPRIEDWTLTITYVPKSGPFKYKVSGSKTGFDGIGNSSEKFVSKSGRVVIDPNDFGIKAAENMTKKKCPVGFTVKWSVVPMFKDTYIPPEEIDPAKENATTVVKLIENGPHTLEIIPNGNGPVPIKEVIIYQPAMK